MVPFIMTVENLQDKKFDYYLLLAEQDFTTLSSALNDVNFWPLA